MLDAPTQWNVKTFVDQIVLSESQGNPAAKNLNSSAMGLGQFVDGTWLDLVKRHRPDIAASRNEKQILELREDPELSRFMTGRYVEQNMSMLAKRGLPVTPASLYLAHFAGPGGAAAILAAPENADAATVIANVDRRPGVTREKIVSGNPFMKNFTAKDLRNWADLKMQRLKFNASAGDEKSAPRTN
ncbi:MAG TPA: transglycosylase SLT domain-containing protein [Methylocystis sp.]|nr:transglycosylase SLT domain-containing protein [Methylocystis sp.]